MDSKQQPNFENCLDEKGMGEVLGENKITLLCTYTCYCYEDCPHSSEVYDLHAGGIITGRDVVAFLTQISWDPVCNHRFLESFVEIRPGLFEMFMGS
jgi:hypothetical protein